jgi:hypothetical protein
MKTTTMTTTDHTLLEQHPLLHFERASDVDPLANVLRFLDRAVSSRESNFAMHFELHAPHGIGSFDFRRAFDRFLTTYLAGLEHRGYAPFCAWCLAGTSHMPVVRLLLLLDGSEPNSIGKHLRSAEHAWRDAHGIADANGLVGYYDHPNSCGNGTTIDSGTDGIDANYADCFRWAQVLVGEGKATGACPVGFRVPGRNRPALTRTRD